MRKVVLIPKQFVLVENPIAREGSAYEEVSAETFKKYMIIFKNSGAEDSSRDHSAPDTSLLHILHTT